MPEDRGRLVTTFLSSFFDRYVEYNFTADLEGRLDQISDGKLEWRVVLRDFWEQFKKSIDGTKELSITNVIDALDEELATHFFKTGPDGQAIRSCPGCGDGRLSLRLGKFGAFIGCSNYPECKFTRQLEEAAGGKGAGEEEGGLALPKTLGKDPATGDDVTLRKGPYGIYVQLGEPVEKTKPKRASLTKQMNPVDIDLELALKLLSLPRPVGDHPETGAKIEAGIGRYGPYLKLGPTYVSLPPDDTVLTIGLNHAVQILAEKGAKKKAGKELGMHPEDGKPVTVQAGRFGPYAQHGALRATLPKGDEMDDLTLERAIEILAAKAAKGGGKPAKGGKKAAAKPAAKKPAAKKATAKVSTAKKPAAKKPAAKKPAAKPSDAAD
jgi:DNA topoisomerase-1